MKATLNIAPPDRLDVGAKPERLLHYEVLERAAIQTALELSAGNVSGAARLIGMDRKTIQRKYFWDWKEGINGVAPVAV